MKYLYTLVPISLTCMIISACGGPAVTPEKQDRIVQLSTEVATLSQTNQALMNDWPIQQAAADTLMLFYHRTHDRYVKNILLKEAGTLQADIEQKKANILANATKIHQDKMEIRQLTTNDELIALLSDSSTRVALSGNDTLIKLEASDSTVVTP